MLIVVYACRDLFDNDVMSMNASVFIVVLPVWCDVVLRSRTSRRGFEKAMLRSSASRSASQISTLRNGYRTQGYYIGAEIIRAGITV